MAITDTLSDVWHSLEDKTWGLADFLEDKGIPISSFCEDKGISPERDVEPWAEARLDRSEHEGQHAGQGQRSEAAGQAHGPVDQHQQRGHGSHHDDHERDT